MKIADFQKLVPQIKAAIELHVQTTLVEMAEKIAEDARGYIGHDQSDWPPLAESTIKNKERLGQPDAPLLATGALRDSIQVQVENHRALIGTDEKQAEYLEVGTADMPPRPFLSKSMMANAATIEAAFAKAMERAFMVKKGD